MTEELIRSSDPDRAPDYRAQVSTVMRLMLITDDTGRSAGQLAAVVGEALAGGVTAVHVREKRATRRQLTAILRRLQPLCRAAGAPLILNSSMLGAYATAASDIDGVQYGKANIVVASAMVAAWERETCILSGYSAHAVDEAVQAVTRRGADYVTLSPIYETPSKANILAATGTGPLAAARAMLGSATIVALGGITEETAAHCTRAGADGVAVIRAIMDSTDPQSAARRLRAAAELGLAERARGCKP